MTKKFEKKESYTHLYAKQLLAEWLKAGFTVKCGNFEMPVKGGNQGIEFEYPIMDCFPYYPEEIGGDNKWLAVADIITKHKGIISYAFEIVNKNEKIDDKLELYASKKAVVFFINASHILGQINRPQIIQAIAVAHDGNITIY